MVSANSTANIEHPQPVEIVMRTRELIAMSARGVNIRDLILSELEPEQRERFTKLPGGPCITGRLVTVGALYPLERLAESCVVFTIDIAALKSEVVS